MTALNVQNYIGNCIITSKPRRRNQDKRITPHHQQLPLWQPRYYQPLYYCDPWTVPIYIDHHSDRSSSSSPSKSTDSDDFTNLAAHTQGLPIFKSNKQGQDIRKTPTISVHTELYDRNQCESVLSESLTSEEAAPLPRILKARKRRKNPTKEKFERNEGGCVTLKPYIPLCYSGLEDTEEVNQRPNSWPATKYPYKPSDRCTCYYCVGDTDSSDSECSDSDDGDTKLSHRYLRRTQSDPANCDITLEELSLADQRRRHLSVGRRPSTYRRRCAGDSNITVPHPPQRPWIPLAVPNRTKPSFLFMVMCYNVLCDKYATPQMYGYCPNWALSWEYRRKSILDEIRHYAADIITLQEVETEQFYNFFLPELKQNGYEGIFSPKSRAKTMSESERQHVDGCAIFYRTSKFTLLKEHLIEFNQIAMSNAEGSDDMLNRVMTKDNIGLAALLQTKEAAWDNVILPNQVQQPILVCTCHIHWDPEFCDVKLIQTIMLMHELQQIVEDSGVYSLRPGHKTEQPNNTQLLLCGDFNSLPESGVVEFLSNSRISADHPDFKGLGYKGTLHKMSTSEKTTELCHSFDLGRTYDNDAMAYTNYTFDFKGIIDYILYSRTSMTPLGILGPLDQDWMRENKIIGCPHPSIPSDHFPLLVELEMSPVQSNNMGLLRR